MDKYVIKPIGGLCNYLRVLFSYYKYCKTVNKHLICIWEVTGHCPGYFLDYFEPLEGVTFMRSNNYIQINYEGWDCHPDYNSENVFLYDNLKLLTYMKQEVTKLVSKISNKFTAIHLRRTDHIPLALNANTYVSEADFLDFCREQPSKYIYIATDNNITQKNFKSIFQNYLFYYAIIPATPITTMRFTDLKHSIIDLFVCIEAKSFMGTPLSSFSDFIIQMRAHRRR